MNQYNFNNARYFSRHVILELEESTYLLTSARLSVTTDGLNTQLLPFLLEESDIIKFFSCFPPLVGIYKFHYLGAPFECES